MGETKIAREIEDCDGCPLYKEDCPGDGLEARMGLSNRRAAPGTETKKSMRGCTEKWIIPLES